MYQYFLFDFDGTLASTKESILYTFHSSLKQHHLPDVDDELIISTIGLPLSEGFQIVLGEKEISPLALELTETYRKLYPSIVYSTIQLFDNVTETLEKLKKLNKKIALVSSRKSELSSDLCHHLGIDSYIDCYIGEEMIQHKKPNPDMADLALKVLGCLDKKEAIMIGDTYFDIKMGESACIDTIFCSYGYGTEESLKECHPTYTIDKMDLSKLLD